MYRYGRTEVLSLAAITLLGALACSRQKEDHGPPSPVQSHTDGGSSHDRPAAAEPPATGQTTLPAFSEWSREEAVAHLGDELTRLEAAVRLVRLSNVTPHWLADRPTGAAATRLSVLPVSEEYWAIGLAVLGRTGRLLDPVFIDGRGHVSATPASEEPGAWLLCVSDAPEYFPHVLIHRFGVWSVGARREALVVGRKLSGVHFDVRERDGLRRLVLVLAEPGADQRASGPGPREPVVVAEYRWDVVEQVFVGPAVDKLPDPPGGRFELDVDASVGLLPVGGGTPATAPGEPPAREGLEPTTRPQY